MHVLNPNTICEKLEQVLSAQKGQQLRTLDVREYTTLYDTVMIVSGNSTRHVKSLAEKSIAYLRAQKIRYQNIEGLDTSEWVVIDYDYILLHIMLPQMRSLFDLEGLWDGRSILTQD